MIEEKEIIAVLWKSGLLLEELEGHLITNDIPAAKETVSELRDMFKVDYLPMEKK